MKTCNCGISEQQLMLYSFEIRMWKDRRGSKKRKNSFRERELRFICIKNTTNIKNTMRYHFTSIKMAITKRKKK